MRLISPISATLIALLGSCDQPSTINLPPPAPAIEGAYIADSYRSKAGVSEVFPVQGKTMTLKIVCVSDDSVQVELEAAPNGDYSPGSNRSFSKLKVEQVIEADIVNKQQQNCVGYKIDLPIGSRIGINGYRDIGEYIHKRCRTYGIHYYFITPVTNTEAVVEFIKI